jgi:hypothetical protein
MRRWTPSGLTLASDQPSKGPLNLESMPHPIWGAVVVVWSLVLLASATGCGGAEDPPADPGGSATTSPTSTSDPTSPTTSTECIDTFPALVVPDKEVTEHGGGRPQAPEAALPERLSDTVLYDDIAAKSVHSAVLPFTPAHQLWSDGAHKQRWVYLPECTPVDTSDMDDWSMPIGTRLFKEFQVDGKRVETRILTRVGPGSRDFAYGAYLWDEDEGDAVLVGADGLANALGTSHDIPSVEACLRCHGSYSTGGGRPSRSLGFAALQLAHDGAETTLDELVADGRLTDAPTTELAVPGDATESAALGYLHANCGHCHNGTADGIPQVDLNFWIDADMATVQETGAWLTAVDVPMVLFQDQHVTALVEPGSAEDSAVWYRMNARGTLAQMPPVGTEVVDADGLALMQQWIEGL